jgi:hypothetical protein
VILADVKVRTVVVSAQESLHRPQIQLGFFDISARENERRDMNLGKTVGAVPLFDHTCKAELARTIHVAVNKADLIKSDSYLLARPAMKYQLIAEERPIRLSDHLLT